MDQPLALTLTLEQYEELHRVVTTAQGKGEFVKVNREALTKLFVDHTRLLKRVPHVDPQKKEIDQVNKQRRKDIRSANDSAEEFEPHLDTDDE